MRTIPYVRCSIFAVMMMLMVGMPASSAAQVSVGIAVAFAPPDLPVYEQPMCPGEGFIWTPGYWAWDADFDDYYWVPGTWVLAPEVGFFWTPGYWAWGGSGFVFYEGFWGPVVGFYGGINYGFGYFGHGYVGGRWDGGQFFYNRTVNNVNVTVIHNVYNTTVINNTNVTRVSYNGGNGGINERARPEEEGAAQARHLPPVAEQRQHVQAARSDPQLRASVNRGKPPIAATPKPGAFQEHGVVHAREAGAIHNAPRENKANNVPRPTTAVHPNELPRAERPAPPNTGNPKRDQKYQQQQEKLYAQQEKDRQKLQQQQEKEHQQLTSQHADEARRQQVEQRHQQQTEQLQQKHSQQQQRLQERQPEERSAPKKEKH